MVLAKIGQHDCCKITSIYVAREVEHNMKGRVTFFQLETIVTSFWHLMVLLWKVFINHKLISFVRIPMKLIWMHESCWIRIRYENIYTRILWNSSGIGLEITRTRDMEARWCYSLSKTLLHCSLIILWTPASPRQTFYWRIL